MATKTTLRAGDLCSASVAEHSFRHSIGARSSDTDRSPLYVTAEGSDRLPGAPCLLMVRRLPALFRAHSA